MTILQEATELKPYMVELRNLFHSHPELGLKEFLTCNKIEEELNKLGLAPRRVGETNVIAEINSDKIGKTLFLRADIDALPIQEANDVPYKSNFDGIMHACGHDGHTAALLGCAKILLAHKNKINGKVILAFQAAEEIGKGARDIIESGTLDCVTRCFGIHFQSSLDVGKVGIKEGADWASCDRFKIRILGKSAHITHPQDGTDALFIASLIAVQLQTVVSRLVNPIEGALIGIGRFQAGTTYNIIASEAELEGTIRAFSPQIREKMKNTVKEIAENISHEYGGKAEVFVDDLCDPCFNDKECTKEAVKSATKLLGHENVLTDIEKQFMADNFADYYRKAPGCYVHVGSGNSTNTRYAHHSDHFDIAEDSLIYAAAILSQYTLDYLAG